MNESLISCILAGLFGGLVRACVGITKHFKQNEGKQKIQYNTLIFSLFTALIAGGVTGVLSQGNWRLAILFGYAGTDLLENLYKITLPSKLKSIRKSMVGIAKSKKGDLAERHDKHIYS